MDHYTKLSLYRSAGVREYWIVDPFKKAVVVYDMEYDAGPVIYPFTEAVRAGIYPRFLIRLSVLYQRIGRDSGKIAKKTSARIKKI